ncbi:conserved repeat domain-containing protein/fimbrial isopeptide formation D2 domain-containing protein [Clostridium collagenovorans DSM 3089]|uniref:Conserved repeat domain-containing protein/fimbrial isopeptide formation D2 domain-containing protein n=1 Tax=Clostridium collagenovorans DSM 3089 TaxID=1121306 RepID=A0A1M5XN20_9CLOT|nr:SdrD B-like domain-containing protein [Clostridium collagenovorans]SHI01227.1 conserved repeat domain-containing protein/fimbrial isopeptide formation D2 domain-containing protein [Clostridium collagenovorans DSM 3089]
MAQITKTVSKTLVSGSEVFIYTVNASYSGLSQPAQAGKIVDVFPSKIKYILPPVGGQIQSISENPVAGGTEVTFNLGPVNAGTSLSFTFACFFGPGRVDNDSFTNKMDLIADDSTVAKATAPTVNLKLIEAFFMTKSAEPSSVVNPNDEVTFTLSLTNNGDPGATINNVVITDVLPPELSPITSFIPIGNDVPSGGYSDPSANNVTGYWTGNSLTFNLSKYSGARYDITFKAQVSSTVSPGETFVNTGKWSMSGNDRNDAPLTMSVYDPSQAGFLLYAVGALTTMIGAPMNYDITNSNTSNVTLSNYVLEDTLPSEVDISALRLSASSGLINYSIFVAFDSNPTNYVPIAENIPNGSYPYTDLIPFIPSGDRITKIKLTAQNLDATDSSHTLFISGFTNYKAVLNSTIHNSVTASSGSISKTDICSSFVNGASDLVMTKSFSPNQAAYYPLEEFNVILKAEALNTITVQPILIDIMPKGLRYVQNSEYLLYSDLTTGLTYDSREPNFPIPIPSREVFPNFLGTGETLLRWSFLNYTLPSSSTIQLIFKAFVEIDAPSSFTNKGYLGMPGNNVYYVSSDVDDPLDLDGDGLTTTDKLSYSELQGVVLSTSEFSLKKLVQGEKDLEFKSNGLTPQGGNIKYRLQVTNNQPVTLKNIEIVDILPYLGDTGVILTSEQRGSEFEVYATSAVTAQIVNIIGDPVDPSPVIVIEYSTSNDPKRFDELGNPIGTGDWSLIPPEDITTLRSIKVTTGASVILNPYDRLIVDIGAKAPVGIGLGKLAYNSYAVRANKVTSSGTEPLLPTEPNKVSIKIDENILGSIGDFTWIDLNGNGLYDPDEPGINGMKVELYSETGKLIDTTVTADDATGKAGYYLFNNLVEGIYQAKFIPSRDYVLTSQHSMESNGSKPDPTTGLTSFITLSKDQKISDINAGVVPNTKSSIGDFVWEDLNKNGIYDDGEPGVNGVTVELYSSTGVLLATTTTANYAGNPGYYSFNELEPKDYKVKFIPMSGFELTVQKAIEPNGSRPDPTTGFTNIISLGAHEDKTDINAGIVAIKKSSIGNFVWNDLNKNGFHDPGEPGVNGVTVKLYSSTGVLLATTTTSDLAGDPGHYIFDKLDPNDYFVKFIPTPQFVLTQQKAFEPNGSRPDPVTGFTNLISLGAHEDRTDINAGLVEKPCGPPTINASNQCIHTGSTFNPLDGVTATDCKGNDLTSKIIVTFNNVDTTKPGVYSVTYSVTDSKGQTTTKTISVKVCTNTPYQQAITDLIESVALEETALAHILNAEGEKIQKAIALKLPIKDLIEVNCSVESMISAITKLEIILHDKLKFAQESGAGDCCDNS